MNKKAGLTASNIRWAIILIRLIDWQGTPVDCPSFRVQMVAAQTTCATNVWGRFQEAVQAHRSRKSGGED